MPCYTPMNVGYLIDPETNKKRIFFNAAFNKEFYEEGKVPSRGLFSDTCMQLPCSKCVGCRLERARQWSVRAVHEASLHEDNCFVTLTFNPQAYAKFCPTGSLDKSHIQKFMKRLRKRFSDRDIRVFYCGEYGPKNGRAHYHMLLFGLDFSDRVYWKSVNGKPYYNSAILDSIWSDPDTGLNIGMSVVCDLTYATAGYVARYSLKKVNGKAQEDFYTRVNPITGEVVKLLPEFCQASLRPAIGKRWFEKYGMTDIFPLDECVIEGKKNRSPRYYDKLLERTDPELYLHIKEKRILRAQSQEESELSWKRLEVKLRKKEIEIGKLVRAIEAGY